MDQEKTPTTNHPLSRSGNANYIYFIRIGWQINLRCLDQAATYSSSQQATWSQVGWRIEVRQPMVKLYLGGFVEEEK